MTTQIESAEEMPRAREIVGRATLAIVESITESETPNATAKMAQMRRGIGIPSAGGAMCCGGVMAAQRYEKNENPGSPGFRHTTIRGFRDRSR